MRGVIGPSIKGQRQAKGGNYRCGTVFRGGTYKIMMTGVGGSAAGIVYKRE